MEQSRPRKVSVSEVAVNRRRGGELRVVLGPATTGATAGFLGVLTIAPGEYIAEHYHPYSEEFLFAIRGTTTVRIDGETVVLRPGEGVLVPRNSRHRCDNLGEEPAEAVFHLCPLAPRPELGHVDTEPLPPLPAD
ncbi:MAG TPA: cupin domain-containing protein [Streptosporangiaceae bacterium]|jgi:putative monooxygenase|nr:cupin domain-containing protein [Streptosporangiaceae bacterium]